MNHDITDMRKALKRLLNTPDGSLVIKLLEQQFTSGTCLGNTPEQTYYRLGQTELVKDILNHKDFDFDAEMTLNTGETS